MAHVDVSAVSSRCLSLEVYPVIRPFSLPLFIFYLFVCHEVSVLGGSWVKTAFLFHVTPFVPLTSSDPLSLPRPPDRRRREVFGAANGTLSWGNASASPTPGSEGGNGTAGPPPPQDFPFFNARTTVEHMDVQDLRPFTVYRMDIHACSQEVRSCSAAAFVYSRTKPAGEDPPGDHPPGSPEDRPLSRPVVTEGFTHFGLTSISTGSLFEMRRCFQKSFVYN